MEFEEIIKLIETIDKSSLNSLEIEMDHMKIKLGKKKENIEGSIESYRPEKTKDLKPSHEQISVEEEKDIKTITSPMVGTFYASSAPDKKPFVQVGDQIKKGQLLCIVEAMKLMNDIQSEWDGTIVEICVENEQTLEYNQPLFKIKV